MKKFIKPIMVLAFAAVILLEMRFGLSASAAEAHQRAMEEIYRQLLPGSTNFTEEEYSGEDTNITGVYKGMADILSKQQLPGM